MIEKTLEKGIDSAVGLFESTLTEIEQRRRNDLKQTWDLEGPDRQAVLARIAIEGQQCLIAIHQAGIEQSRAIFQAMIDSSLHSWENHLNELSVASFESVDSAATSKPASSASNPADLAPTSSQPSNSKPAKKNRKAKVSVNAGNHHEFFAKSVLWDQFQREISWFMDVLVLFEEQAAVDRWVDVQTELDEVYRFLDMSDGDEDGVLIPNTPRAAELLVQANQVERDVHQERTQNVIEQGVNLSNESPQHLWSYQLDLSSLLVQSRELSNTSAEPVIIQRKQQVVGELAEHLKSRTTDERKALLSDLVQLTSGKQNELLAALPDMSLPLGIRSMEQMSDDLATTADLINAHANEHKDETKLLKQLRKRTRGTLQDLRLQQSVEGVFGRFLVTWWERLNLVLVFAFAFVLITETILEWRGGMTPEREQVFAWLDLFICLPFLIDFFVKMFLSDDRWLYFKRHWLIDFVAAIPFGFFLQSSMFAQEVGLFRVLRFLRLGTMARYLRLLRPLIRLARMFVFVIKASDNLVLRHANLFNQQILLFEPEEEQDAESKARQVFRRLRAQSRLRIQEVTPLLTLEQFERRAALGIDFLQRILPTFKTMPDIRVARVSRTKKVIRLESLVQKLTDMTPDSFVDQFGQPLADSIKRYVRLFRVPIIRRLPIIRDLLREQEQSSAAVAALACQHLGALLQRFLDFAYLLADLHGTVSGPMFLDRLGTTIVTATYGPTKRLIQFSLLFFLLQLIFWGIARSPFLINIAEKIGRNLGYPVLILGGICSIPLLLGLWLQRLAKQSTRVAERIVEAQFIGQTRSIKYANQRKDMRFICERVIAPEIELRGLDNRPTLSPDNDAEMPDHQSDGKLQLTQGEPTFINQMFDQQGRLAITNHFRDDDEMRFIDRVERLYDDYLQGAFFHRNDVLTSTHLSGNLAIENMLRTDASSLTNNRKQIRRLDLTQAGGVFGGPYLWFLYLTRSITQSTSDLILDYNRHASPVGRLANLDQADRKRYVDWLSKRLGVKPEEIQLPNPTPQPTSADGVPTSSSPAVAAQPDANTDKRLSFKNVHDFYESLDFHALDFLSPDRARDQWIERYYGPQLKQLLLQDRKRNIRAAFKSFALKEIPAAQRTVNPFAFYDQYVARGKVVFLPFRFLWLIGKILNHLLQQVIGTVRFLLTPPEERERPVEVPDSYDVVRRKVLRMRRPLFMQMLWLRARHDVEYLGIKLPNVPATVSHLSLMDLDFAFIGATKHERSKGDQMRITLAVKVNRIDQWLERLGWNIDGLVRFLQHECPDMVERTHEVMRAMVAAAVVDHDDLFTLGSSIDALTILLQYANDPANPTDQVPLGLPQAISVDRPFIYKPGSRRSWTDLLRVPGLPEVAIDRQLAVVRYLRTHSHLVSGWVGVILGLNGQNPWDVLRDRFRQVMLRTDVWSNQLVTLRTIQSLAILDVHHYCSMTWRLGQYEEFDPVPPNAELPFVFQPQRP